MPEGLAPKHGIHQLTAMTRKAALEYVDLLEMLHEDPSRQEIAWLLGVDTDIMDETIRRTKVRNWIEHLVVPSRRR